MLGFGVSAVAAIDDVFAQNHKQLDHYDAAIDAGVLPVARGLERSLDDQIRREVIMSLICRFSLDFQQIEQQFNIDFACYFGDELAVLRQMEADGLLQVREHRIEVLPAGRLVIRRICMVFDVYVRAHRHHIPYSKII
jgi:oxygen-independent coproporphyrinogen-3 oxidase